MSLYIMYSKDCALLFCLKGEGLVLLFPCFYTVFLILFIMCSKAMVQLLLFLCYGTFVVLFFFLYFTFSLSRSLHMISFLI